MFLVLLDSQILKPVLPEPVNKFLQWNISWLLREIGSNIMPPPQSFVFVHGIRWVVGWTLLHLKIFTWRPVSTTKISPFQLQLIIKGCLFTSCPFSVDSVSHLCFYLTVVWAVLVLEQLAHRFHFYLCECISDIFWQQSICLSSRKEGIRLVEQLINSNLNCIL